MSWTTYTDRLVEAKVDLCAIHGTNGAAWAQVAQFTCSPAEIAAVAAAISNDDSSIYGTGVELAGKRWTVIRLESDSQVLVLKGKEKENLKQTLVVAVSTQVVVLGANSDESLQGSAVRKQVEEIRDYLKGCGY